MNLTATLTQEDIDRIAEAVVARLNGATGKKSYTLKEAAQALNLSERTVRNMVTDGRLRRLRGTARMIFPATEIDKLLTHGL